MSVLLLIRRLSALALVTASLVVWLAMAPEAVHHADFSDERTSIEADDDANNQLTEGAPQQTVVNGWTAIDYLALVSQQLDHISTTPPADRRPGALLLIGLIGLAIALATSEPSSTRVVPVPRPPFPPPA